MQAELVIEAILKGDKLMWSAVLVLWVVATALVLAGPRERAGMLRTGVLFAVACATTVAGAMLARALSIPRIVWREADAAELVAPGGETWRRLRGPGVAVQVGGLPEIAVPTVDASGRWVLFGLFSGHALEGLPPAPVAAPEIGGPRLCPPDGDRCRAWPSAWPDPAASAAFREMHWSKQGATEALAYDAETGFFLHETDGLTPAATAMELMGRLTNDPPREGTAALFVARRIAHQRLEGVRVVATASGGSRAYRLHRAGVSLAGGVLSLRWLAGPMAAFAGLSLMASLLAFALAPAWLAARLRRRSAIRRELSRALVLMPISGPMHAGELLCPAIVSDDADWGETLLRRGTRVSVAMAGHGEPVASRAWFELPEAEEPPEAAPSGEAPGTEAPSGQRRVGLLVPADAEPFRRAARAWVRPYAYSMAILATSLAVFAPAVVAVAAMLGGR